MKCNLRKLQDAHGAWADVQFKGETLLAKITHLAEEVRELRDACEQGAPQAAIIELADCQLLLVDIARQLGVSAEAHIENCFTKLDTCKRRQWAQMPDGAFRHIEPPRSQYDGALGRTVEEL